MNFFPHILANLQRLLLYSLLECSIDILNRGGGKFFFVDPEILRFQVSSCKSTKFSTFKSPMFFKYLKKCQDFDYRWLRIFISSSKCFQGQSAPGMWRYFIFVFVLVLVFIFFVNNSSKSFKKEGRPSVESFFDSIQLETFVVTKYNSSYRQI